MFETSSLGHWWRIVARNLSSMVIATVLDSGLRFVAYGIAAQRLGPEAFGLNAWMYSAAFFFGGIADFGLQTLGVREIATHRDNIAITVSRILSLKIILTLLSFLMMVLFVFVTQTTTQARWLGLIYCFSLFGISTFAWILIGLEEMHYPAIAKIANGAGVFVLVLLLIHSSEDLI